MISKDHIANTCCSGELNLRLLTFYGLVHAYRVLSGKSKCNELFIDPNEDIKVALHSTISWVS